MNLSIELGIERIGIEEPASQATVQHFLSFSDFLDHSVVTLLGNWIMLSFDSVFFFSIVSIIVHHTITETRNNHFLTIQK